MGRGVSYQTKQNNSFSLFSHHDFSSGGAVEGGGGGGREAVTFSFMLSWTGKPPFKRKTLFLEEEILSLQS